MKILIISNLISYTYNFRKEIIESFITLGHEVTIIADNDDEAKNDYFANMGCEMLDVPYNGKGTNIREDGKVLLRYIQTVKKTHADIVFSFTIKPNLYGGFASRLWGIPYVPMITGLGELEKEGKLQSLLLILHKLVIPGAKCVIFQNADNKEFFQSHGIRIREACIVPGSGINLQEHKYTEYPDNSENVIFGFVGRLTPAKGIEEFLCVAERMRENGEKAEFIVAGKCDEQYKERVKRLDDSGVIQYRGLLSDTRDVYRDIHCLVLPTYHPEGISNVLLEAAAAGRPSICTNRTGCKEVVQDGVNGLYCAEKDWENLYQIMKTFIHIPWEQKRNMGVKGRKIVEAQYSRDGVVDRYAGILKRNE